MQKNLISLRGLLSVFIAGFLFQAILFGAPWLSNLFTKSGPADSYVGPINCSINLGVSMAKVGLPNVEGWPYEKAYGAEWLRISNSDFYEFVGSGFAKFSFKSPNTNKTTITLLSEENLSITGKCQQGSFHAHQEGTGAVSLRLIPSNEGGGVNSDTFNSSIIGIVHEILSKFVRGVYVSSASSILFLSVWLVGHLIGPRRRSYWKPITGFYFSSLLLGGLHYFFNIKVSLIFLLIIIAIIFTKRISDIRFGDRGIFNTRDLTQLTRNVAIFSFGVAQFSSSFNFRNIGVGQTDTFNYRVLQETLISQKLLDVSIVGEGNGNRSIDYTVRAIINWISPLDINENIHVWAILVSSLLFVTTKQLLAKLTSTFRKFLLCVLTIIPLLSLWIEGYLSRFSLSIAAFTSLILMLIEFWPKPNLSSDLIALRKFTPQILIGAYCFAIVPVFMAPWLFTPLYLLTKRKFRLSIVILFSTLASALPSTLWLRNYAATVNAANDGFLDSIVTRFVLPHWDSIFFLSQLAGTFGWHSQIIYKNNLDNSWPNSAIETMINFVSTLGAIISIPILTLSIIYHFRKYREVEVLSVFSFIIIFQFFFFLVFSPNAVYVQLMHLVTLFPLTLINLVLVKNRFGDWKLSYLYPSIITFFIVLEGSIWFTRVGNPLSDNTYWTNVQFASKASNYLDGIDFQLIKGSDIPDWIFFVRGSELVASKLFHDCVNCKYSNLGLSYVEEYKINRTKYSVVVNGDCPSQTKEIEQFGTYLICKRH